MTLRRKRFEDEVAKDIDRLEAECFASVRRTTNKMRKLLGIPEKATTPKLLVEAEA